jgi:hypothetical protein
VRLAHDAVELSQPMTVRSADAAVPSAEAITLRAAVREVDLVHAHPHTSARAPRPALRLADLERDRQAVFGGVAAVQPRPGQGRRDRRARGAGRGGVDVADARDHQRRIVESHFVPIRVARKRLSELLSEL